MRFSVCKIFLLMLLVISYVDMSGQTAAGVTLKMKDASLSEILMEINKKTDYEVQFFSDDVKDFKGITIDFANAGIEDVMKKCLEKTNLSYIVKGKTVVVSKAVAKVQAPAQVTDYVVNGLVTDNSGEPLPGAAVMIKGVTGRGAIAGADGRYTIKVSSNETALVFSYIGFEPKEELLDGRREINAELRSNALELGAVVITGIFKKSADNFTGAVSTVTGKELLQNGNRNLIQSLNNIDPSINIISNNLNGSNPNRLPELQIRGNSSMPNVTELKGETMVGLNTPLVVLDGFETTLQKLYDINESEVESLTILKDASATSIYGSRGANGVIVITTKMPVMGKLRVSYRGDINIETPDLSEYNVLNAADKLTLEDRVGLYTSARAENQWQLQRYYNYLLNEVNSGVDTYWLSKPLRVGVGQKHNMRIEGGDRSFRYSASAQYNDIQGVMRESFRKTFNGTINLSYFLDNVKFTNKIMIGLGNTNESRYGSFSEYVRMNPYLRPYDENGNVLKQLGYSGNSDYELRWSSLPTNPLYNASLNTFDKSNSTNITNNFSLEWKAITGLTLRAKLGLSKDFSESDVFKPADHTAFANYGEADMFRKGSYSYAIGKGMNMDGSLNASYNKQIGKSLIYAGLDYNMRQTSSTNYGFLAEGFSNEKFDFISMALQYAKDSKPSGSESMVRSMGITANFNYTYDNKYYVDVSGRRDGSSQYGSNKRFATFWSTGLGWNLHNESFLKGNKYISFLKIRGSVGTTGSQNFSPYQAISTYKYFTGDKYYNWLSAELKGLGNPDLQWQQKLNTDIGLEAKFIDNRFSINVDYYTDKTTNLISSINTPASNGFTSFIENVGEMKNHGFEIMATAHIIRNPEKGIYWNVTAAAIQNNNTIVEVSQALLEAQEAIEMAKASNPNILYKPGYSTNTLWVVPSAGIDPSNGKEIYIDRFGEQTYEWDARDIVASGVTDPKVRGMISTMFRYKGITLNASFGYRYGGYAYNSTLIDKVENADYNWNVDSRVYTGRWNKAGDIAAFKGIDVTTTTYKTSRFVQKENVFNCQNITLQYELKSGNLIKKIKADNILFTAGTSDLFYFSTVRRERGLSYPFSRQYNFSINITF